MLEQGWTEERVRAAVTETVAAVMAARGLDADRLAPQARLAEGLGLKSMDLAQIVLELEDRFDCDPFRTVPITSIRTVDDLGTAYMVGLGLAEAPADGLDDHIAAASARRARRRR